MSSEQTQQADDPSGEGWRDVGDKEPLQSGDMYLADNYWRETNNVGGLVYGHGIRYRRRIEPQPEAEPQPEPQPEPQLTPDDPSGPGWRDVEVGEVLRHTDMVRDMNSEWVRTGNAGWQVPPGLRGTYRRRIEPQQPSDSEPETMEQLREQVQDLTRQAQFDAVELQQLREQLDEAQRTAQRYRNQLSGAIEHSSAAAGRQQVLEALQTWLRPVLELVAEHPEDASPLAVAVLGYLPGIASRLIEE